MQTLATYAALGVYLVPLVLVAIMLLKVPLRQWIPWLGFLGVLLSLHLINEYVEPEVWTALIYLAAGAYER